MLSSVRSKIAGHFVETGLAETKDIEVYEFGLKLIFLKFIHVITILFIALIGNELLNVITFLLIYMCIREYSGGYHSKTPFGCYTCTIAVTIAALAFFKLDVINIGFIWLTLIVCGIIIWLLSPQENENNPLEPWEIKSYSKKTRLFLLLFAAAAIILHNFYPLFEKALACALLIQSIMLLVGKINKKIAI